MTVGDLVLAIEALCNIRHPEVLPDFFSRGASKGDGPYLDKAVASD
jgi:hypothetical protein